MKRVVPTTSSIGAVILLWLVGLSAANAQEELLDRALKDQDRRTKGLTALADQVRGFLSDYLPDGWVDPPQKEEPPVPESSAKVEVREVKITEAKPEASSTAEGDKPMTEAQKAELEKIAYQQALFEAATKLNITGAFPQRKQVMVGAQNLGVGEEIAIEWKAKLYNLQIVDITATELKLRDKESQYEVSVELGVSLALPPGMSRSMPTDMFRSAPEKS